MIVEEVVNVIEEEHVVVEEPAAGHIEVNDHSSEAIPVEIAQAEGEAENEDEGNEEEDEGDHPVAVEGDEVQE